MEVEKAPNQMLGIRSRDDGELVIVKEADTVWVKKLKTVRASINKTVMFAVEEESDGLKRIMEFFPIFKDLSVSEKVYVIDELDRSMNTDVIKELLKQFSQDKNSRGQLIFTSHEPHLMDTEINRKDENGFAEKDNNGPTIIYSMGVVVDYDMVHS